MGTEFCKPLIVRSAFGKNSPPKINNNVARPTDINSGVTDT